MKKLLEIFKKKEEELELRPIDPKNQLDYLSIDGNYYTSEVTNIKVQASVENKTIYGWALEIRWHQGDGIWCPWVTQQNNKIYHSQRAANEAALHTLEHRKNSEWRVRPLYVLDDVEWRDFKIEKLLKPEVKKEKLKIKAWKVKEDVEVIYDNGNKFKYKKGTLFIKLQNGHIIDLKNSKTPTSYTNEYQLKNNLIPKGLVLEVKLEDEKWSHPHLLKELKNYLKYKEYET